MTPRTVNQDADFGRVMEIPSYLKPYIATQDPTLYTPMDHAGWRFILKISKAYFAQYAHQKYLDGLSETGISVERIPLIQEMDERLRQFGWRAVAVSGFIPPAVFMEFLSLGVLPIACDMRKLEHLAYTPAPDIVHEAAGHAPIVADPEYRDYLRSYGEISQKAIFSNHDVEVYEAIRELSEIKEDPVSTPQRIHDAEERLNRAVESVSFVSEATLLSRMGWWTFEYGLVGNLEQPKVYGAGLLSSMGESFHCLGPQVKKLPFSIDCVQVSYDITRPQPQLFVARDFHTLKEALQELGDQMAFRKGGEDGLKKAIQAQTTTTTALESGTQISGTLESMILDENNHHRPCYLKFSGPTQLAYQDTEIQNQGADYHREGFGTPLESVTDAILDREGIQIGHKGVLAFRSGVTVEGVLRNVLKMDGRIILLTWDSCRVTRGAEVLFRPEWGTYDMICGEKVVSVFGGAADRKRYLEATGGFHQEPGKQKSNLTNENRLLNELYREVRVLRESQGESHQKTGNKVEMASKLEKILQRLNQDYPKDWLLRYEVLELGLKGEVPPPWAKRVREDLQQLAKHSPELGETILRGLALFP